MDLKRIFLGGLVAGVTFLLITGIVSGVFLKLEMENWMLTMKEVLHPPAPSIALALWATMCLLYGQAGIWFYAVMRSRFGAGHGTAILAGVAVWFVGKFLVALDFISAGILPLRILTIQLIASLLGITLGILFGSWFYRESESIS